ncbi:MAG TPA: hypothetical protein VGG65_09855 [Thermoanaerobaculia bacterium]
MAVTRSLRNTVFAIVLLSLTIGCQRETAPSKGGSTYLVTIGPTSADISREYQEVETPDDQVWWVAIDGDHHPSADNGLLIEFEKPEVFPQATKVTVPGPAPGTTVDRYQVYCRGANCQSGPLGKDLQIGKPGYKYWQVLVDKSGKRDPHDGRIIIKQP